MARDRFAHGGAMSNQCPSCTGPTCICGEYEGPSWGKPLIREWYDGGPSTAETAPSLPGDRVQLPAIRCSRAEREAWQRKAAARGVSLSELVRTYLEGLP